MLSNKPSFSKVIVDRACRSIYILYAHNYHYFFEKAVIQFVKPGLFVKLGRVSTTRRFFLMSIETSLISFSCWIVKPSK